MNVEKILILAVVLYLMTASKETDIEQISCDDPRADPVMCRLLGGK